MGRALAAGNDETDYDTDAVRVARAVRKYWGDEAVEVLERAVDVARFAARKGESE